jgi:predicted MFS family arabinose efflux permease
MEREKTNWFVIIILWFAGISAAMQFAKFSYAFIYLKDLYNVGHFWMGLSLSVVALIGLIFGLTISIYISKIGQSKILLLSLLLSAVLSLLQALFIQSFPLIFVTRILEGISHLGILVTAPILIISLSAKKHQSIAMGLWSSFFGVSFFITPLIGRPIMEMFAANVMYSVDALFLLHAAISLLLFIVLFFLIRKIKIPHIENKKESFLAVHKKVYSDWKEVSPGILFFFHTFMFIALFTFLPGFAGDEKTRHFLLIVLPLLSIAGTFAEGIISQYFMLPSRLNMCAYIALVVLILIIKFSLDNVTVFIVASMILLFFSGIIQGSVFSIIPSLSSSADEQTNENGAVAQLGNLGSIMGAPVISHFLVYGENSMILIIMFLGIMGAISAMIITRKIKAEKR